VKKRIGVFLLMIVLLSGCGIQPSSETQQTGSVSATSRQETVGSLPGPILDLLGSGFNARQVFALAGLTGADITAGHYRFAVDDNEHAVCDFQVILYDSIPVLKTAILSDHYGHRLIFSPVPDSAAINDYQIITSGMTISLGASVSEQALIDSLGKPLEIARVELPGSAGNTASAVQTCYYPGLVIELRQPLKTQTPDNWLIIAMTCSGPGVSSPRGLQPGMSYQQAVDLFGTGEFILCPDILTAPTRLTVCKISAGRAAGRLIELNVANQIITSITMSLLET